MSNGLTVSYPHERQALSGLMLLVLALGLLVVHILLLMLASIPPPTIQSPPQERRLRISLAPMLTPPPMELPEGPKASTTAPETPELTPAALAQPAERPEEKHAEAEKAPPEPAELAEPKALQPEPEPKPETAAPKPEEPNLEPLVKSRVADDTAAGQDKPPENPQYLGATNSEAADRSDKTKIGPDPKIDGESSEVAFSGRRGETENKQAPREDPAAGAIKKEGTPDPGTPPEPQKQVAKLPEPEPAVILEPVAKPEEQEPEAVPAAETKVPLEDKHETAAVKEPEPDGVDPLKQMAPVPEEARRPDRSREPVARRQPEQAEPRERTKLPVPAPKERELAEARRAAVSLMDPELARLQRLLNKPQAAPENAHERKGAGTREGQVGHEGDGRKREGELNAVSDVISATMTSAAKEGDVAFSKRATPELAYLKPFFRRMDAKWKAVFFSDNRALSRLNFGEVKIRFTFDKKGKLIESVEVSRNNEISDRAVNACLEGIRRAAPHDAFPPNLADRQKLTTTVVFLYR